MQADPDRIFNNENASKSLQQIRAYTFELFVHYIQVSHYAPEFRVHFNIDQKSKEGEKDIVVENANQVILIECKLTPDNYDLNEVLDKLRRKQHSYHPRLVSLELWFWHKPSAHNLALLNDRNVKTVVVSTDNKHPLLKGKDLKRLKAVMSS